MRKIIRGYLIFAGIYILADALIHLLDIKLIDVKQFWQLPALIYGSFVGHLYASFALLVGIFSLIVQKDINKYKSLIKLAGVWGLFHGLFLFQGCWFY